MGLTPFSEAYRELRSCRAETPTARRNPSLHLCSGARSIGSAKQQTDLLQVPSSIRLFVDAEKVAIVRNTTFN